MYSPMLSSSDDTDYVIGLISNLDEARNRIELHKSQINTDNVSRIFSLNPDTLWLRQQNGRKVIFPDQITSNFDFPPDIKSGDTFFVHGNLAGAPRSSNGQLVPLAVPSTSRGFSEVSHYITPSRPMFSSAKKHQVSFSLKIVQANMKRLSSGKIEFTHKSQMFIDIKEDTANVHYITDVIQRKWGNSYVLVTNDGLMIEDCSGTNGLKFWKVGSRKIYAVKKEESCNAVIELDDSDSEFIPPQQKFKKSLQGVVSEVKEIRKDLKLIFKRMPVQRLHKEMYHSFICHICMTSPAKPPIIYARCCMRIVGCKPCVDTWYHEDQLSKVCPICRTEGAYSETSELKGLDDFLMKATPIINNNVSSDSDSDY